MALEIHDRVKETTTTTGTGTYTLAGAVSGFETFTANLDNSDTTYYVCTDNTDFEVGLGTFTSSGTTLSRDTILASSNSNNEVNWSSGTRSIFMTYPADKAVFKDASNNINGTFVGNITGNVTGNTSGTADTVTGAAQTNITSLGTLTALTVDDVAINGKVVTLTGSSSDTATLTAGTNGTLDIVTTDAGGASANIQITADGTAELAGTTVTLDSSGGITLDADGGTITFADAGSSLGTITSDGYTGNVVGNLTGNVTGNTSGTAATVTGAAQTNITSVGTLSSLATSGDITVGDDLFVSGGLIDLKNDGAFVSQIKFYCESSNQHAQTLIGAPHNQTATNTLTLPDGSNGTLLSTVSTATLTNKTFDVEGTGNSISNIDVADLKSGVLDTDISSVSGSDDTLASAKAIKTYVDAQVTAQDLDVVSDSGTIAIDLDSETLTIAGGTGLASSASSNTVTLAVDAAQTGITSLLATDIKIGEDDQTKIDFETADTINFYAGNEKQLVLTNGALTPGTNAIVDLGTDALEFKDAYFDGTVEADAITIGGTALAEVISDTTGAMFSSNTETGITVTYQDADNTIDVVIDAAQTTITSLLATDIKIGEDDQTKIDFETANTINFYAGNEKQLILTDGALTPGADNILDLGSSGVEFKDAYFDGTVTSDAFAGPLTGDVTGNADTATALAAGRTIGMTGDVVWTSASFTGAGNVTGSATIQAGAVENSMLADDAVGADELASNAVVNASVASGAAIAFSKMANLTTGRALVSDGSGDVSVSAVTATEIGHLDGVTSAIQTQIDAKTTATAASNEATALARALG
jgi:uncharacterized protein YjbJ (UPF0337 family)